MIPALDSRTRVILLQHPSETAHALNTARLAALGLNNAELRVGEVFDDLGELLATPDYRPALLFPGDDAQVLTAYGKVDDTPLLLIVPDGTWRKARKLLYAEIAVRTVTAFLTRYNPLERVLFVCFDEETAAIYRRLLASYP
ncbi:MAG: DTW domain-containing protein [Klebsiella sp.]|nr:DTW domain-containing protein [Klebsiella sp.]